jgi:hypothetical protein
MHFYFLLIFTPLDVSHDSQIVFVELSRELEFTYDIKWNGGNRLDYHVLFPYGH